MKILYISLFTLFLTGCVFPVPNSRVESYGIKGTLFDHDTKKTIKEAVIIGYGANTELKNEYVEVDKNGNFSIEPFYQWHYGFFFSPISYPIWPFTGDIFCLKKRIKVIAPNYPATFFVVTPQNAKLINNERFENVKIYIKKSNEVTPGD